MIISFVNQKGGVGKTTTAINFAASLARKNKQMVFMDADPQASATTWHEVEGNQAFEILSMSSQLEQDDIQALNDANDYVVIDTPPAINAMTESILTASDMVVVPVSPSSLDVWSTQGTLEMINTVKRANPELKVKFLINRKIPGTRVGREVREALKDFDPEILDTELCQRVAYIDAMKCGVSVRQFAPTSKAAEEVEQLCNELVAEQVVEAKEAQSDPIAELYKEETDNVLFRSFQTV